MQAAQICFQEEQEEWPRQNRNDEALQVLPQAYSSQGNKVIGGRFMAKDKETTSEKKKSEKKKQPGKVA